MKQPKQINEILSKFENQYGLPALHALQGSDTWFQMKLGVMSASNADKIVAKTDSETRRSYMAELVAQVCTGIFEEINAKQMDWGKTYEDAARSCYEFTTGETVEQATFVFKDDTFREGCSPDFLIYAANKGGEIKCPFKTENYIKFITEETVKPVWKWQNQFSMRTLEADLWDFGQYDPRMKAKMIHFITVERDLKMQATLEDAVPQFRADMDKMLAKIGVEFGSQWANLDQRKQAIA